MVRNQINRDREKAAIFQAHSSKDSGVGSTAGIPRVSIIMPFLNLEQFIEESIESVLCQTYKFWELLLIDDGSNDESTQIAREYSRAHTNRIRYFEHKDHANLGASASRNVGIRHSRGEFIAFLDGDDIWLKEKLEQQVAILDAHPEVGSVYGNTLYWQSWNDETPDLAGDFIPALGVDPGRIYMPPELLVELLSGRAAVPCTCSILIRRSIVEEIGAFEERFQKVFTDQAFYAKLFLRAPVYVTDHCWDKYRQHSNSSCNTVQKDGDLWVMRLDYLQWITEYLDANDFTGSVVHRAAHEAIWLHRHPGIHRLYRTLRRIKRVASRAPKDVTMRIDVLW